MQKTIIVIATLLVVASVSIGIIIGLTWNMQASNNSASPTPTIPETTPTNTPFPDPTPAPQVIVSYNEVSRTVIGNNNRLTLSVYAYLGAVVGDNKITLDYSNFTLAVFVPRGGLSPPTTVMHYTTVNAEESDTVTAGGIDETEAFQLTFEFPSNGNNFDGTVPFSDYQLGYSGNPSFIEWRER